MRIVAISDTHSKHRQINLPAGDILIHAGDFSSVGKYTELVDFLDWFKNQPHKHKVFIAGNHDFCFEREGYYSRNLVQQSGVTYLEDSDCVIEGLKIYGSPITPTFFNWAFNRDRGESIRRHWDNIPADTDILITHGPPHGVLDYASLSLTHVGCEVLRDVVLRVKPKLHIFGHIHETSGVEDKFGIKFVNASCLDLKYKYVNLPKVIDI